MSYEEATAAIARETGWSLEYVLALPQYWRLVMLGWKPGKRLTEEQVDQRNRMIAAQLQAEMGRRRGR